MRDASRGFRRAWIIAAAVSLMVGVQPSRAEVAAVGIENAPALGARSIYLGAIVEDPSPIGSVWMRHSAVSADRAVLNEEGAANGDGPPAILGNPSGLLCLVAWARNSAWGYDVVYSRFESVAWSEPAVLAGAAVDELDPALVQGPDGTVHLFYWEQAAVPRVMHRSAPPDLSSWSAPVQVSETGIPACRPHGIYHDGTLFVAYEVHDYGFGGTPRQVVVARSESGIWIQEVLAITHNSGPVFPQIHSRSGYLWADWEDAPGEVLWRRRDAVNLWEPVRVEPYSTALEREFFVRGRVRDLATAPTP